MSIPKADKGLAEFVKTLDPSMYTISGGAPQPNPVANEVKSLKEQQEYQWYQTTLTPPSPSEVHRITPPKDAVPVNFHRQMVRVNTRNIPFRRNASTEDMIIAYICGVATVLIFIALF